jgi:hypothetical protein
LFFAKIERQANVNLKLSTGAKTIKACHAGLAKSSLGSGRKIDSFRKA